MDCQEVIQEEGSIEGEAQGAPTGEEEAKGGIVPDLVPCRPTEPGDNRQSQSGLLQIAARMRDKARMKGWKLRRLKEGRVPRRGATSSSQVEIVGVQKKNSRTRGMIWKTMSRMRKIAGRQMARWMEAPMKMQMRKSRGG